MKNRIRTLIAGALTIAGALMLNGCGDDTVVQGHGGIAIKLGVDSHVINSVESRGTVEDVLGTVTTDQLKIKLEHESGKHVFSYQSADKFPTAYKFPIGKYAVTASCGDASEEGIDKPAFEGKANIEVFTNEATPVDLTASLANCIVQVDYTSGFKVYMKEYYCELNSASGKTYRVPELDEDGNLFVKPGSTSVTVHFVRPDGKPGSVTLPQFDAEPQHLYKVTFDINAQFGVAELNVSYNDKTIPMTRPIDLSKDIDVIPVPYLVARGFDPKRNAPVDFIESLPYDKELDVQIIAMGGLQSVKLQTTSRALCIEGSDDHFFPKEIELMGISEEDKELLSYYGLEVFGLWNNPDQMGIIDFGTILKSIRYINDTDITSFTVVATDRFGRESAPMTLNLKPIELELRLTSTNGTDLALGLFEDQAHVHVRYSGGVQFADQLRFEYVDENGNWRPAKVLNIEQSPASSFYPGNDKFQLCAYVKVPATSQDVKLHAHCGNKVSNDVVFKRVGSYMKFDKEFDSDGLNTFAKQAKVHLEMAGIDRNTIEIYARKKGEGENAWTKVQSTPVPAGSAAATITLTDLTPGTNYEIQARASKTAENADGKLCVTEDIVEVNTEKATQLPNGNMDDWCVDQNYGGRNHTDYWWIAYPGLSMEGTVWGTMNQLTTSEGGGDRLSTGDGRNGCAYNAFSGTREETNGHNGKCAVISTVGWGKGNTAAVISGMGTCNNLTPGELYLSGTCNVAERQADYQPYAFTSRPSGLKFWYKYTPKNSVDYGYAVVEIYDSNKEIIASNKFEVRIAPNWTEKTLYLTYPVDCAKAAYIQVKFKSSDNSECHSINSSNLDPPPARNLTNGRYTGSEMYIDDIELIY
ncbi:MAG: DUF4493 domain-containing protein [Muribaculaceae bacterium]|nr:DUF4493 domain-containing protein [Muribaculaceae bacterium]